MLNSPSVNMLANAITQKFKQPKAVERYLKQALYHPNRKNSICNPAMLKFYDEKTPLQEKLSDQEIATLASYFIAYQKHLTFVAPPSNELLNDTYSAASILTKARNENKRIIIEAISNNCEWCEKMKQDVLRAPRVQQVLQSGYVFADVNVDKHPLPYGLKKRFKQITPTFFILESDGTFIARHLGSLKKDEFIRILQEHAPRQ
jgi:glutaredoxin